MADIPDKEAAYWFIDKLYHAKLVRTTTCGNGNVCDHTICGDKDAYLLQHEEYVDKQGYRKIDKSENSYDFKVERKK